MNTYRKDRANTFIQEELTLALGRLVKDPRATLLTITAVELTPDKRVARVYVAANGGESELREGLAGLRSAQGLLRHHLSQVLHWRFTPQLEFRVDTSLDYGSRIEAILATLAEEDAAREAATDAPGDPTAAEDDEADEPQE